MRPRSQWIQRAIRNPGSLHKQLGIPKSQKIPLTVLRRAASSGVRTSRRARLALTLRKLRK